MEIWVLYVMDIAIFITFFLGMYFILRWKFNRDISPSKQYPNGKMACEFWQENGRRVLSLLPIEDNGFEVRSPGHHLPRYFFKKSAVGKTKYPFTFPFARVDVDICSWIRDCPEPIDPENIDRPFVTAELLAAVKDTDDLGSMTSLEEEMNELLKQATKSKLQAKYVYLGLGLVAAVSLGVGYFLYMKLQAWGF